ncbi:hypothetical protein HRD84_13975 [Enterococcus faecalis]|nr:hypothetical protein [Enterococcus faecalis]
MKNMPIKHRGPKKDNQRTIHTIADRLHFSNTISLADVCLFIRRQATLDDIKKLERLIDKQKKLKSFES